ncbi:hypothetical protein WAX86_07790 [Photobacterium damselae subsp. damselae]|uniref:hypothetical protein n=1 Tax=Photobacterium damselae TaxID=38293 RepID=UPI00311B17C2
MVAKIKTKSFCFGGVRFIPENRQITWDKDKSCFLSEHENRLLCTLCSCAGEVVSIQTLYQKTFIEIDPFEDCDQQYDLNLLLMALSKKLNYRGQMLIPIHVIPSFGYRVPLPHRKSQSTHKPILQKSFPSTQNESDTVSCINLVKFCQQHKKPVLISVFLLILFVLFTKII